jgi:MoxR-like ATPase
VRTGCQDERLVADAVTITRATRSHIELRRGSSARGATDLVAIAVELENLGSHPDREALVLDAALLALSELLALSARIGIDEAFPDDDVGVLGDAGRSVNGSDEDH